MTKKRKVKDLIEEYRTAEPPIDIEGLIAEFGIELDKYAKLPNDISGQIELIEPNKYKISVNRSHPETRKRFTMAHELGHYLLHKPLLGEGVTDNKLYRSENNKNIKRTHETEANKFAAYMLMPQDRVREEYKKSKDTSELAERWGVSEQALKIKLGIA